MTYNDLIKVKRDHSHDMYTSGLIRFYFILDRLKFDVFVTIYDHSKIFYLFFYVVTFDDLAKVKQGHSRMGSISSLYHSSMTNNP